MSSSLSMEDRVMKDVPFPERHLLVLDDISSDATAAMEIDNPLLNISRLQSHFQDEGRLSFSLATFLLEKVKKILFNEPNVIYLSSPVTIVGDLHGQFFDLCGILGSITDSLYPKLSPENHKYLFLGDYIDRGNFGTEICFLLFALKIAFPSHFILLRGNHECRLLTNHFNFKSEVISKYNATLYNHFMMVFDALPLSALIDNDQGQRFLALHGGLSPEIPSIEAIDSLYRFREPPQKGPLCDILWSDPLEEDTAEGLDTIDMEEWYGVEYVENPTRGCGFVFGYSATRKFLLANDLTGIIRGHEVQKSGFHCHSFCMEENSPHILSSTCPLPPYQFVVEPPFPLVITVFSAPNYCDFYRNKAAILTISDETKNCLVHQYIESEHPYVLPNFQNAFSYSFPLLTDKLAKLFGRIAKTVRCADKQAEMPEDDLAYLNKVVSKEQPEIPPFKKRTVKETINSYLTQRQKKYMAMPRQSLLDLRGSFQKKRDAYLAATTNSDDAYSLAQQIDIMNEARPEMSELREYWEKINVGSFPTKTCVKNGNDKNQLYSSCDEVIIEHLLSPKDDDNHNHNEPETLVPLHQSVKSLRRKRSNSYLILMRNNKQIVNRNSVHLLSCKYEAQIAGILEKKNKEFQEKERTIRKSIDIQREKHKSLILQINSTNLLKRQEGLNRKYEANIAGILEKKKKEFQEKERILRKSIEIQREKHKSLILQINSTNRK